MKSAIVIAALIVLTGGLAACDSGTVTQPRTELSAPGSTTMPEPGAQEPGTQEPGDPEPGNPEVSVTAVPPGQSPAVVPARGDKLVDPRPYQQQGDNFYFQSPTGNIMCGILTELSLGVGCQLARTNVIPAQLPDCTDAPDRKVAVHVAGGTAEFLCTSQGIFVGESVDGGSKGGGKVLNYGDTISILGTACTSTEQGMRCEVAGRGFFISADQQSLF
ncbi:DUF6636 domain-containing protein [Nocardia sp. NPDC058176]|uniref:DUF6636 domain-containing protein n=1 Tax=Nocardia sp. NPDC058176 TaxID=3346368 RepID=UPI0036D9EEA1